MEDRNRKVLSYGRMNIKSFSIGKFGFNNKYKSQKLDTAVSHCVSVLEATKKKIFGPGQA